MRLSRTLTLLSLSALLLGLLSTLVVQAQAQTTSDNSTFTVAAGQTATVNVNVFCLDYGKDFPAGQPVEPNKLADPPLVAALQYAISKGYDQSDPRSVQLALWYLRDNTYHTTYGESSTRAQEIVSNAGASGTVSNTASTTVSSTASPAVSGTTGAGGTTTLQNAILNNQVKFGVTGLKPITSGQFYGTAILQVQNLTSNSLTLTLPLGSTFGAPAANFQTLIGYATGNSGSAQATTTAASTTVSATTTTVAAITTAATTTVSATTVAATTTDATTTTVSATTVAATTTVATGQGGATGVPATGLGGAATSTSDALLPLTILLLLATMAIAATGLLIVKRSRR